MHRRRIRTQHGLCTCGSTHVSSASKDFPVIASVESAWMRRGFASASKITRSTSPTKTDRMRIWVTPFGKARTGFPFSGEMPQIRPPQEPSRCWTATIPLRCLSDPFDFHLDKPLEADNNVAKYPQVVTVLSKGSCNESRTESIRTTKGYLSEARRSSPNKRGHQCRHPSTYAIRNAGRRHCGEA